MQNFAELTTDQVLRIEEEMEKAEETAANAEELEKYKKYLETCAFLDNAVNAVFHEIFLPISRLGLTSKELQDLMNYLDSAHKNSIVFSEISDKISELIGHVKGIDEDEEE